MTRDEFEALVKKLEAASKRHPRFFFAKTVALVGGAYAYLFIVLAVSVVMCGLMVAMVVYHPSAATIKIGFLMLALFGGMLWAIVRGLWVRIEPPKGIQLTRRDVPDLFTMLDGLRAKLDCQPFHEVLLIGEHNAAVVQAPRLGVFGWYKNYLLLGLPLMQGMGPEEFRAVLAHEFTHSSRGHGRFGNWLYRLRRSWERVVEEVVRQQNRAGHKVMSLFLKFFWPKFNAHSFVLSRENEYEADRVAAQLTSNEHAATALMRLNVNDRLLDQKFWPDLFQRANTDAETPADVFTSMAQTLKSGAARDEESKWLRQSFVVETSCADTHPSLKDRLSAMGISEERTSVPPLQKTATEAFLGNRLAEFTRQTDEQWRKHVEPMWKKRHEEAKQMAAELAALDQNETDAEALWKKVQALINLKGDAAAAPFVEKLLAIDPKHKGATYVRGRHLLQNDDPAGVEVIEQLIAQDLNATEPGCQVLYAYYRRAGRREKLRELEKRVDTFRELQQKANQERQNITADDTFIESELKPEQIEKVRAVFAKEANIGSVAIARKEVEAFPDLPAFVVAIRVKVPAWKFHNKGDDQGVVDRVIKAIELPGHSLVFVESDHSKAFAKKIFAVPNAVVYERPEQ